ncbi:MAG: spore germination protein [Clostridia bacterium]|nr:spore germination protein [Clostridia bacterium]MDD4386402.1 spore germination protein [Clostridia bacterium]
MKLNIIKRVKKKEEKIDKVPIAPVVDTSTLATFENLQNLIGNSEDIKYRDILINNNADMVVKLILIDGLISQSDVSNYVIKPLMQDTKIKEAQNLDEVIKLIQDGAIYFASQKMTSDLDEIKDAVMDGNSVLLFSQQNIAFEFDTKGFDKRSMMEPTVENVTKGPKDSFVENYRTNTATIRRKIRTQDLVIENMIIGKQTHTTVAIVYIKSILNDEILQQVKDRLNSINTDNLLTTSVIEDALSENIYCPFPQVVTTERPDKFCADIIEGRAGIIVSGLPFGFVVPGTFVQYIQNPEDYSHNFIVASAIRIIRYLALFISLLLPGLFIAITTFHTEMIPTDLALFLAKSREGVTFPVIMETICLLIAFEILYEAGLRVPKTVGQAVSIVGTLVVGQAAVEARLLSPAVVVVVAMTSIASFTMPNQDFNNAIRIWRILFSIFGAILGLVGIISGVILITFELCKLKSYGVPYLSPFVSNDGVKILDDTIFRIPQKDNKIRPKDLKVKNIKRQGD